MNFRWIQIPITASFLVLIGCSDSVEIITSGTGMTSANSEVTSYFPLDEGYTTIYQISSLATGNVTATFKVGEQINLNGESAYQWFSYDQSQGTDTGYFKINSSSLNYYASSSSEAEKILDVPLSVGKSWNVSGNSGGGDGFDDTINANKDDDDSTTIVASKNIPIEGSSSMNVIKIESITLSNGSYYSQAFLVKSSGNGGYSNYYWFVRGVGLVKYALDATDQSFPNGTVVGELIAYGIN